jgi:hypothetical protein
VRLVGLVEGQVNNMASENSIFNTKLDWNDVKKVFGIESSEEEVPIQQATASNSDISLEVFGVDLSWGKKQQPAQIPSTERRSRRVGSFDFKRGDVRGNIQLLLNRAESPDYFTAAGGAKVPEIKRMTVEQIGKKYGNKALGRYQIQYNTAIEELNRVGIKPSEFVFDEKGQDKIFDLLLKRRGKIQEYRAGKISREEVAQNLATIWAGFPKDASGKSRYEGVGNNKAHVEWNDVLLALE